MSARPPGLDELISMNYEIAGLVRAGVPLELGLKTFPGAMNRSFNRLKERVANRLSEGQSLPDALDAETPSISPIYSAVVKAGLQSGNLTQALESLAQSGHILQQMRRHVAMAAVYPLICLLFAYFELCFFIVMIVRRFIESDDLPLPEWMLRVFNALHHSEFYFTTAIPLIVIVALSALFFVPTRLTRRLVTYWTESRWLIGNDLDWSQMAELLALQLRHGCPLPNAFVTAANATDNSRLKSEARQVANQLNHGEDLQRAMESARSIPPMMKWMIATGAKQGGLVESLQQLSDSYRQRVVRRATLVKIWLPVFVTIFFTGGLVLAYTLAFFLPLRAYLMGLS